MINKTGSVTTLTPSTVDQAIPQGYYGGVVGDGKVVGDADLITDNIKSGANIFGVAGNVNVVDTSAGTATASQMLSGAIAFVDGVRVTGTMVDRGTINMVPSTANQAITAGKHSGGGIVYGDADLVAANIKSGANIFGVAGSVVEATGNAVVADVLATKTFSKAGSAGLTGTMVDRGTVSTDITTKAQQVTIAAGKHSGTGIVKINDTEQAKIIAGNIKSGITILGQAGNANVVDTSGGDVIAGDVLSGKKAYVDGALVTGNIPSKGVATITPGTTNQTIAAGQYLSGIQTITGDADLVAANILSGVNIFGVAGSAINGAGMKRYASGDTTTGADNDMFTISGLAFTPGLIMWESTNQNVGVFNGYANTSLVTSYYLSRGSIVTTNSSDKLLKTECTITSSGGTFNTSAGWNRPVRWWAFE